MIPKKISSQILGIIFILCVWILLFKPVFSKGLLPIPADIITGVYYPWLDYKWGFPNGVPVKNPLLSDIPSLLYPWRNLVVDQIKQFRFPLWNQYYFTGMPLLANFQSSALSYVNLLFLIFPKELAWSFGVMLSPILTMFVMFFFLRWKKFDIIPSILGSIVFSLSGFQIAWLEYNLHGHTVLFFVLILFSVDKILNGKIKYWLFLLPVFVSMQIFTGYIPLVIYGYLTIFLYVFYFYLLSDIRNKTKNIKTYYLLASMIILGIFMFAIQLFPGIELVVNSIRLKDSLTSISGTSFLPIGNLVTLFAPDYFGNPSTYNYFGKGFYDNFYFFTGTGTLFLIALSIFNYKKEKAIKFWLGLLLLSILMVLKYPFGVFFQKIFFLSGGVAARALFTTDFSLAILSAYGMQVLLKEKLNIIRIIKIGLFGVVIFIFAIIPTFFSKEFTNVRVTQRNLIIPFSFWIISFFCILFISILKHFSIIKINFKLINQNIIRNGFCILLLISIITQLIYSSKKYLPFSKKELLFPTTPIIDFLLNEKNKSIEPFRIELGNVIPQNFLMPYGLETSSGYDALLPKQTGEFLSLVQTGQIDNRISRIHLIQSYWSKFFPLLNTKYILAKKLTENDAPSIEGKGPAALLTPRYKLAFEDKTVQIYEDKDLLPRAFIVHDFELINQDSFINSEKKKYDFKNKVYLEKEPDETTNDQKLTNNTEIIDWIKYEPGFIKLSVNSASLGYLVLLNNYYPGWKAYVNGTETEIYRSNFNFQSIIIPSGKNDVLFEYDPQTFKIGKHITILSIVGLLIIIFSFLISNHKKHLHE